MEIRKLEGGDIAQGLRQILQFECRCGKVFEAEKGMYDFVGWRRYFGLKRMCLCTPNSQLKITGEITEEY